MNRTILIIRSLSMYRHILPRHAFFAGLVLTSAVVQAVAAPESAVDASSANAAREKAVAAAIDYLKTAQAADGSYSAQAGPAMSALVTTVIFRKERFVVNSQVST